MEWISASFGDGCAAMFFLPSNVRPPDKSAASGLDEQGNSVARALDRDSRL